MDDKDLDFAAFMERAAGPEFADKLKAVVEERGDLDDEQLLIATIPVTIGQMRVLRDSYTHVWDHECAKGAEGLIAWAALALASFHPFLEWVDSQRDEPSPVSGDWGHDATNEDGDDGADGGVQGSD